MAFDKLSREINGDIFIEICGNNLFNALKIARKYNKIKIEITLKKFEAIICDRLISLGWSDTAISEALEIQKARVKTRRKKAEYETQSRDN